MKNRFFVYPINTNKHLTKLLFVLVLCISPVFSYASHSHASKLELIDSIIEFGKKYLGKPYRYKEASTPVMDCSGFVSHIYQAYNLCLPHSSSSISLHTSKIDLSEVRKGDLLFFKGRNTASNSIGHVSMVVDIADNKIKMMHSCQRGIRIDDYPMPYYGERFLYAGRLSFFEEEKTDALPVPSRQDTLKIMGVGDMMLGTNFPSAKYLPPDDGKNLLAPVAPLIRSADIAFGNLEGVLLSNNGQVKKCKDTSVCYAFKSPDHYVNYYKETGFDILSLANNHVGDFGDEGRSNTVKLLQKTGIHFAGLENYPYTVFTKDSITYGFCAFAPNAGTVKINNYEQVRSIIRHLDTLCDIVIVSFHGGAEGAKYNRITRKTEMFLGENRGNPYEFARVAIDAGADIVFGHGPHVARAVDVYKDRFIAYSMGNFATYSRFNLKGLNGLAPLIEVHVDKEGRFLSGKIYSATQSGEGGPVLDENHAAAKEIKRLTQLDIPEAPIKIDEEGNIRKK